MTDTGIDRRQILKWSGLPAAGAPLASRRQRPRDTIPAFSLISAGKLFFHSTAEVHDYYEQRARQSARAGIPGVPDGLHKEAEVAISAARERG